MPPQQSGGWAPQPTAPLTAYNNGPPQPYPAQGYGSQPSFAFQPNFHPQAGYGQPRNVYPPYGSQPSFPAGGVSPKNRTTVILLCFFLGGLGIHRFYLGKIVTGVLMALTLGGLGIWTIVDFFISIFGNYTDATGLYVDKRYKKGLVTALIILVIISPIFLFLAVLIPNYSRYKTGALENTVKSASVALQLAEETYFALNSTYTADYGKLEQDAAFKKDPHISYGALSAYPKTAGDSTASVFGTDWEGDCFSFEINSVDNADIRVSYDSCAPDN
jgi:TM2 domain-containing membrane protein YozV